MKNKRWVLLARVSSQGQIDNTSIDKQTRDLRRSLEKSNGEAVSEIERAESGAQMDRDSLNKILDMSKDDEFDVLGVWKLDRLTRSDPWECINYLRKLREHDITLYSDNHGYFDWDDRHDFQTIVREVLFSRESYARIHENSQDGQIDLLKEGKFPFGDPHFGYTTEDDDTLRLTDVGAEIIPDVFNYYIKTENKLGTKKWINSNYASDDDEIISYSQTERLLTSRLCLGQLTRKDVIVARRNELQCVSNKKFNKVQTILNGSDNTEEAEGVPKPIERATQRFGPEFISSLFDKLNKVCPECDGDLAQTSQTKTVRDRVLIKYRCEHCDFVGPLFNQTEIDQLDSTLPLACPFCTSVGNMSGEKTSASALEHLYTCNYCNNKFAVDVPLNKYKRAFENPDVAYRWDPNQSPQSEGQTDQISSDETGFIWGATTRSDD
jgi:DNA invertase Pin-like site-specific DNA recombinase/predicted RNA-binding Zn-ribbon protein involved in translation (DUF1610 family)